MLAELNRVIIYIKCKDLPKMDIGSLTDPCVKVFIRETREELPEWNFLGMTEVKNNTLNPDFETSFTINFYFERE